MTQDEKYMKAAIREAKKAYVQTVDKYHVIRYNRSDLKKL